MRVWRADLHVHTCLSPCADLAMAPRTIIARAAARGLDAIGVADHNSAANAPAVQRAARGSGLTVFAGMEVTSREEVHILALFGALEAAFAMQEFVQRRLPGRNRPEIFGLQVLVNEEHDVLGFEPRLLAGATGWSLSEVVERVHRLGGLAFAAHADREAFGLLGHLGLLPRGLALDGLELSPNTSEAEFRRRWPECAELPLLRFSDAHSPEQIGRAATGFRLPELNLEELRKALRGAEGRGILTEAASLWKN
ncbi:MAG: PHP domain-containing protein [Bryobacterales bacterium]|nr:PHP domain-containing protein [Bryobacteraceae bacterium]MDW8129502.1 PHP domain-containing protein [Bryobacterales bacterium]